jgi:uncharacterized protein (DUF1800 family)
MGARDATTATRRFGLGARPGDIKRIASDPRGYVQAALADTRASRLPDGDLAPSHVNFVRMREIARDIRLARQQAGKSNPPNSTPAPSGSPPQARPAAPADSMAPQPRAGQDAAAKAAQPTNLRAELRREVLQREWGARLDRAARTDAPFLERLVLFWSNHFSVSAAMGPALRVMAGAYEREAIRPHVLGRFADMLRAVEQHPAMLIYLDNAQSIGPNSRAGRIRNRGLNENLAREILELHTLGVDAGYTQADVTNLARIITGWSVGGLNQPRFEPGRFAYFPQRHEPGDFAVLGRTYKDHGQRAGEAVLDDLARHPATARHIARKLAVHFVSDKPPPALLARLERTFRDTEGNLRELARTLAASPEAWEPPPRKIVPPYDFIVQMMRGLGLEPQPGQAMRLAAALGQPTWAPPSPKGWPEHDDAWMGPSAIRERLRFAERAARQASQAASDPRQLAENLLGPGLSTSTRQAIARAETREQGLGLMIMSPEYLRR